MKHLINDINDTLGALAKSENAITYLEMLGVISTLLNELDTKRFGGAEYTRKFEAGRLKVTIDFTK